MRYWLKCALLAASLAGTVAAASGLSIERSGLGLKPPSASLPSSEGLAQRKDLTGIWQSRDGGEVIYAGAREATRLGLRAAESYGGVYYPLSDGWGASLEFGVIPGSALAPQRYSVAGLLHTALSGDSSLSIGLKYRLYEPDFGSRAGMPGDLMAGNAYSLASLRVPGAGPGPSYQLQLSYQYNAANIFGLALGRELETFTPGFDLPGAGPRHFTFTGQHWLTPSWALSYDVLSNDPGTSLRVQGLRLGVRYRF